MNNTGAIKKITRSVTLADTSIRDNVENNFKSAVSSAFSRSSKTSRSPPRKVNKSPAVENERDFDFCQSIVKVTDENSELRQRKNNTKDASPQQLQKENSVSNYINSDLNFSDNTNYTNLDLNFSGNTTNLENITLSQNQSLLEIEGFTEQPSLVGDNYPGIVIDNNIFRDSLIDLTESNKEKNQETDKIENNNTHIITNMPLDPLRLPLKHVANLVPEFDGKNISVNEYIEKLKHAKAIINPIDEKGLIQVLKIKLKGEAYKALINTQLNTIEEFIKAIRKLYPSTENVHSLYGKLTEIIQQPNETVLEYGNRLQELVIQIKELKRLEGLTEDQLRVFENLTNEDALKSFRNGLRQEIRLELGEGNTISQSIQKAIEIETNLNKQKQLRVNTAEIMFHREKFTSCQICKTRGHEALFCNQAACVYCKNKDHYSNDCKIVKKKINLICKYCSMPGHSLDTCKLNKNQGNHCQYCQVMGHTVSQCPFILEYEVCWKCKESGHDPNTCTKSAEAAKFCEYCNSGNHTIQDCPTVLCQRCNQLGHALKYCPISENRHSRYMFCLRCKVNDHETDSCPLMPSTSSIAAVCQICDESWHAAKDCPHISDVAASINVQESRNFNNGNQINRRFNQGNGGSFNNRNFNQGNGGSFNNRNFNKSQTYNRFNKFGDSNNGSNSLFCTYCKTRNHTIANCRKLKALTMKAQENMVCDFCQKEGHNIDNCKTLLDLQGKVKQFCTICKGTNHIAEECLRNKNRHQGNE